MQLRGVFNIGWFCRCQGVTVEGCYVYYLIYIYLFNYFLVEVAFGYVLGFFQLPPQVLKVKWVKGVFLVGGI